MHFEDGQFHLEQGEKPLKKGDLQMALAEFEKAQARRPFEYRRRTRKSKHTLSRSLAQNAAATPKQPPTSILRTTQDHASEQPARAEAALAANPSI